VVGVGLIEAVDAAGGVHVHDGRVEDQGGIVEVVDDAVAVAVHEVGEETVDVALRVAEGDVHRKVDAGIQLAQGEAAGVVARAAHNTAGREDRPVLRVEALVEPHLHLRREDLAAGAEARLHGSREVHQPVAVQVASGERHQEAEVRVQARHREGARADRLVAQRREGAVAVVLVDVEVVGRVGQQQVGHAVFGDVAEGESVALEVAVGREVGRLLGLRGEAAVDARDDHLARPGQCAAQDLQLVAEQHHLGRIGGVGRALADHQVEVPVAVHVGRRDAHRIDARVAHELARLREAARLEAAVAVAEVEQHIPVRRRHAGPAGAGEHEVLEAVAIEVRRGQGVGVVEGHVDHNAEVVEGAIAEPLEQVYVAEGVARDHVGNAVAGEVGDGQAPGAGAPVHVLEEELVEAGLQHLRRGGAGDQKPDENQRESASPASRRGTGGCELRLHERSPLLSPPPGTYTTREEMRATVDAIAMTEPAPTPEVARGSSPIGSPPGSAGVAGTV
jgi:hypothetical protein